MLLLAEDDLCVCELTFALQESQPKISRHLALLRDAGVVEVPVILSVVWIVNRTRPAYEAFNRPAAGRRERTT